MVRVDTEVKLDSETDDILGSSDLSEATKVYEENLMDYVLNNYIEISPGVKKRLIEVLEEDNPIKKEADIQIKNKSILHLKRYVDEGAMNHKKKNMDQLYNRWWKPIKLGRGGQTMQARSIDWSAWMAGGIADTVYSDFDFMCGVVGYEGTGKSSIALGLARDLTLFGFDFDLVKNMFFSSTPTNYIIDKIQSTKKQIFIFDEADAFFDSRNSQKKEQKELINTITLQRARNHVYILCTPDIAGIDVRFRERRITHILHLLDRNMVALLIKHNIGQTSDGFGYAIMQNSMQYLYDFSIGPKIQVFLKLPACYNIFELDGPPISKEYYNLYKTFKLEFNKMLTGGTKSQNFAKKVVVDLLTYIYRDKKELLFDYANKRGVAPSIITSIMKMSLKPYLKKVGEYSAKEIMEKAVEEFSIKDPLGLEGIDFVKNGGVGKSYKWTKRYKAELEREEAEKKADEDEDFEEIDKDLEEEEEPEETEKDLPDVNMK